MIYTYSQLYRAFHKKCLNQINQVLINQVSTHLQKTRFLHQGRLWPMSVVFFDHPKIIGQFNPNLLRLEINKRLIGIEDDLLMKIIQHELAHYLTYIEYGPCVESHGREFRAICAKYDFQQDIPAATLAIEEIEDSLRRNQKIFEKVTKLFQLASSSNPHESELALIKANQLLHQHQLDQLSQAVGEQEIPTSVLFIQGGKRFTAVDLAIYEILKNFYVAPVLNHGRDHVSIEIIGTQENVELASYIANFLKDHLEKIWSHEKNINPAIAKLNGKNTFMKMVALEYSQKIQSQKTPEQKADQAVLVIEDQITTHLHRVHPRLSGRRSNFAIKNSLAYERGSQVGRNLNIRPALKQQGSQNRHFLLE
jgi:predicted SprT family Zn-dependent metalloprotease